MSDIVERLRKPNMNVLTAEERVTLIFLIMHEAADEIERLEERHDKFLKEFWATNADNTSLRAVVDAAQEFTKEFPVEQIQDAGYQQEWNVMCDALAALKESTNATKAAKIE